MAKEPDDLVLRLLREIRAKQDAQGTTPEQAQKRVEDLASAQLWKTARCA